MALRLQALKKWQRNRSWIRPRRTGQTRLTSSTFSLGSLLTHKSCALVLCMVAMLPLRRRHLILVELVATSTVISRAT